MEITVNTIIDSEKCNGCGLCVKVCPRETLSLVNGKACVTGKTSNNCGHCVAACPKDAIRLTTLQSLQFSSFNVENAWIKHSMPDVGNLVQLMASRRSCRNFKNKPVDRGLLEDLVTIGTTAPTGSNSQEWTFTILPDRSQIENFGDHIMNYFQKLNRMSQNALLRKALSILGKNELERYYHNYYERNEERIRNWKSKKKDMLFHGAPAVILVGTTQAAACPKEDALLATQNILLAAHAMGLGTCLIGFAVMALTRDASIHKALGLGSKESIHSAIAIGWPNESYSKIISRKKIRPLYASIDPIHFS